MEDALFSKEFTGGRFYWWIGQVCQSKFWRENLTNKPVAGRNDIPGFGYRYKVRIMGIHDKPSFTTTDGQTFGASDMMSGGRFVKNPPPTDEELPWCGVINSPWGGGEGASLQTPGIRQGSFVFGFFLDGLNQQNPVILGVLGNHFKYRAKDGVFRTFAASTGYDGTTDNQVGDYDIPTERNLKSESCDAPNLKCAATEKEIVDLERKTFFECVYEDGSGGGIAVAFSNMSNALARLQRGISEYPSALATAQEKIDEILDDHLGEVTKNMGNMMSLIQAFSTKSLLEKVGALLILADPTLKDKLGKIQTKQLEALMCMFNAIQGGLGKKVRKSVRDKLIDNLEPIPEGYYLANDPCFTESIMADVIAQSLDDITGTMDSSNKNLIEEASGLLGGLSNLSSSALLPTGLLSGVISQGLGSFSSGLNLGGAMSFISGLTKFFACLKEALCTEIDTVANNGDDENNAGKTNKNNAMSKVEQEKKNQEIQAYADDNGISFDRAKNFLEGGAEETVFDGTKSRPITPPTNAEVTEYAENNLTSFTQARKAMIRDREIAAANADITAYAEDNNISFDRAKNFLEGNVEETVIGPPPISKEEVRAYADDNNLSLKDAENFLSGGTRESVFDSNPINSPDTSFNFNPNLDYGNLTGVDYSKYVDDTTNYFDEALKTDNIPFTFNLPNALDTKISEDDQRWLDSKENLVNIAQILKPLGVPSDFAKYAIQYAKGDDTPITSFSAGTRKAIETIVLRKYKNNPSLFANGKKVQINYGDYGQGDSGNQILDTVESLRFPNVRLGLGTFTVSVNDQGLINVTDTFNVQQDFKGTYAFSGVPTLEDSASRIVDIAHKVRGVSPGQEDKGGIPINVTFSSNKLKKEIEKNK